MRRNKLALYLHLVWATWDREPAVTPAIERPLYRCIESEAQSLGCMVLALNGMPDHVHLVLIWPATLSIADLVKQVKGASSHLANDLLAPGASFRWQAHYGAFTLGRSEVERVIRYVRQQQEHHAAGDILSDLEECVEMGPLPEK